MENRIRELRKELHMSQVRLAIELGVSQETVSAYENQKHYPSFLQLVKLSDLFHASIDYIMGLSEVRVPKNVSDREDISALLHLSSRMTDTQIQLALSYVQGILDSSNERHQPP